MRLNLLITCIAIAAVTILTSFFLSEAWNGVRPEAASVPTPHQIKSSQASNEQKSGYLLKEYDGKLAVFFPEEEKPRMVFDVYVATLPPYDRGQLMQGVYAEDYEQLLQRIEDYIS